MNTTLLAFGITLSGVYLFCLLVGLIFAVASALLGGLGHGGGHDIGGHDIGGHDIGGQDAGNGSYGVGDQGVGHAGSALSAADSLVSFSPLSPVVVAMFVTAFGAAGLLVDHVGLGWFLSVPLSTLAGLACATGTFYLFAKLVVWAQGASQTSVTEALGATAEVVVPIPSGGVGQIAYTLQDRRFTAPARTQHGGAIANHTMVVIQDVSGSTFLVRLSDEEQLREMDKP